MTDQLLRIVEPIGLCSMTRLENLYSATSGKDYDARVEQIRRRYIQIQSPPDVLEAALELQRDLAHHHGMWHRVSLPDLVIATTALAHGYGVLHHDGHYERIAKVRPLITKKIG